MTAKIFKFPARGKKPAGPEKPAQAEKPAKIARTPNVLLVVGQDEVRDVLAEGLVASGIKVTPHKLDPRYYPAELLGLFEKNRFDVVIPTNLGIPFVYVPDLVSLTQKFGRGAGIVVISGWVQDDFVAELAKIPRTAFLEAPVKIEELAVKVKELAAEPAGTERGTAAVARPAGGCEGQCRGAVLLRLACCPLQRGARRPRRRAGLQRAVPAELRPQSLSICLS